MTDGESRRKPVGARWRRLMTAVGVRVRLVSPPICWWMGASVTRGDARWRKMMTAGGARLWHASAPLGCCGGVDGRVSDACRRLLALVGGTWLLVPQSFGAPTVGHRLHLARPGLSGRQLLLPPPRVPGCLGGSASCTLLVSRAVWEAAPPASSSRPGLFGRQLLLHPPRVPGCLGGSASCTLRVSRAVWEAAPPASSSCPGLSGRQRLLHPPSVPGCLGGSSSCILLVSRAVWEAAPPASSSCPGLSGRKRLLHPPRVPGCLGGSSSCILLVSRAVWKAAPPAPSACPGSSSSCLFLVFGLRGALFSTRLRGNRPRLASAARNHTARGVSSGIASRRFRRRDVTPRAVSASLIASVDAAIALGPPAEQLLLPPRQLAVASSSSRPLLSLAARCPLG